MYPHGRAKKRTHGHRVRIDNSTKTTDGDKIPLKVSN